MNRIIHTTGIFLLAFFIFGCGNFIHDLEPTDENRITAFEIDGQIGKAVITNNTISVKVEERTDITSVIPRRISVSPGATLFPVTEPYMEWMFSVITTHDKAVEFVERINKSSDLEICLEDMIKNDPDFKVPVLDIPIDFSDPENPVNFLVMSAKGTVRKYTCEVLPQPPHPGEPEMVFVQGGTFMMGSPEGVGNADERPAHQVTLSSFSIGKFEVTQVQWVAVMGSNPSWFHNGNTTNPSMYQNQHDNNPVENVNWYDVQEFVRKLNELTGKQYRLPTEAEWEYAARGGNQSRGYIYSGSDNLDEVAWTGWTASHQGPHPVGLKQPNELGIYDMSGNVAEWCSDWLGGYTSSPETNPQGPLSGTDRVIRGGGWTSADGTRVTQRSKYIIGMDNPGYRSESIGFRLVLPVADVPKPEPNVDMVWIPAGTFMMGSPEDELGRYSNSYETLHQVTLTKGFYIGKYPVTQALYEAVMGNNPSYFNTPVSPETTTANHPVERVSWYDALVFCNKLSMNEGLSPSYNINGSTDPTVWGTVPTSKNVTWDAVIIVDGSNGYRLPTEAQWEYACRAGTTTAYNTGATVSNAGWYSSNSGSRTHEVGLKSPNTWGLYDMHGNVTEWCWDWYNLDYYYYLSSSAQPAQDPTGATGPASIDSTRVVRGGSWYHEDRQLRSAYQDGSYSYYRGIYDPNYPNIFYSGSKGFRLVLPVTDVPVPPLETVPGNSLSVQLDWLDANAQGGKHYLLSAYADESLPPRTMSYGKTLTATLRGVGGTRTVSLSSDGSLFTVGNGVTLILDIGVTLQGRSSADNKSLVMVAEGGTLVINAGAKIKDNETSSSNGGGVYVGSGTFTMNGGEISNSSQGVYVGSKGTFTMNGGEISSNTSNYSNGGGVYLSYGTFTMNGGKISGNTSGYGGGVFMSFGTFTMNGGEISGNKGSYAGGGVHMGSGTFTMNGGEISGNTGSYGGGVYVGLGTFRIVTGTILRNTANQGAALYVVNGRGEAQYGTFSRSTWNSNGNFGTTTDNTIRVVNGVLQ